MVGETSHLVIANVAPLAEGRVRTLPNSGKEPLTLQGPRLSVTLLSVNFLAPLSAFPGCPVAEPTPSFARVLSF